MKHNLTSHEIYDILCRLAENRQVSNQEYKELRQVTQLCLRGLEYTTIPESISHMEALEFADFGGTNITFLPVSVCKLASLKVLNLSGSLIVELPSEISLLQSLRCLNLSGSALETLPNTFGTLNSLEELYLDYTHIRGLPEGFCSLPHISTISLKRSWIETLPGDINCMKTLRVLNVSGSRITTLPPSIRDLSNLTKLDIGNTDIVSLPEEIADCQSLLQINICNTPISSLPMRIALGALPILNESKMSRDRPGIYASGAKLPSPYYQGEEILRKYYTERDVQSFREAKIVFLGDGAAGKTYLVNRFMKDGLPEQEPNQYSRGQTHGVMQHDYICEPTMDHPEPFTVHLWDFGGQEMLHAMHRCFLTEYTVYVIVLSTRASEHTRRIRYWLRSIVSYASGNAVTIIINRYDDQGIADIDKIGLKYEFQSELELDFVELSAKDASRDVFKAKIIDTLISKARKVEKALGTHPASYMRVKDHIKTSLQDIEEFQTGDRKYVNASEFLEFCAREKITDAKECADLLRYYTDLGVCFSLIGRTDFVVPDECRLIPPIWLTNALYAIIEECRAENGEVKISDIQDCLAPDNPDGAILSTRVLPKMVYQKKDCEYILHVAAQHGLVLRDSDNSNVVFIPAMCRYFDKKEEYLEKPEKTAFNVICEVTYSFLPETIVQRLMMQCRNDGYTLSVCWKGGFRLTSGFHTVLIDTINNDSTIRIDIWSTEPDMPVNAFFNRFRKYLHLDNDSSETYTKQVSVYIIRHGDRFSERRLQFADQKGIPAVVGDHGDVFLVSDLLGKYTVPITHINEWQDRPWTLFELLHPNTQEAFECLCYELFQHMYYDTTTIFQKSRNNPGVEIVPIYSKKINKRSSFQSKFFESADAKAQIKQIVESARNTIKYYKGQIDYMVLYCNRDLPLLNEKYKAIKEELTANGIELLPICEKALYQQINRFPDLKTRFFQVHSMHA